MAAFRAGIVAWIVLAWLITPDTLCLIPGIELTSAEHECCRRMAGACGTVPSRENHSCCKTVVNADLSIAAKYYDLSVARQLAVLEFDADSDVVQTFSSQLASFESLSHSPPTLPGPSCTILRI